MHTSLRAIAFGVALLISGTSATVSLSSFTPRINNIGNTQCESAYNTLIKGCQASDFGGDVVCSAACIRGLQEITQLVQRSCSGVRVDQSSIIGVFQSGIGIKSLCPKNEDAASSSTTAARTTTAAQSTQAATSRASTSATPAPSSSSDTTSSTLDTQSSAAQSSTSSSTGLVVDPSPTSVAGSSPTGDAQLPASSTGAGRPNQPQLSNQDSGGGSPFDVQSTGDSSRTTIDVMLASFVGTALLFVACA
ncbi:hypothetical protein HBH98_100010 [Parastagonospora nodorum]|nr:hypothetical protein HBH51_063710 [Parastagonospora nodorum]KAH3998979.1 hypothetical protein HBI10_120350 [Parastagonospora nodorum]KAH4025053.1 hypothetical protein HBI13_076840 [Parastagonospora nodorum]KAH4032405.1 hypothetical protein HBI09_118470 [Parastagonospora nodorum]KAH4049329.1 hypothetical protein HBH49_145210 [Parastagonospora nodorum]